MEMMNKRTRFLPQLDDMAQQDRNGAIADMIQKLREMGAVKQANAAVRLSHEILQDADRAAAYRESVKRQQAKEIGCLLLQNDSLAFNEREEESYVTTLTASALFVVK